MMISEEHLKYWIEHFYGFGSWHAKFWFISHEEGGGNTPDQVVEKINFFRNARGTKEALSDIRALYKQSAFRREGAKAEAFGNLYEYRFDKKAVLHGVWKNLIAFIHGYQSKALPDLLAYQRKNFAVANEALIPLYPLPSPHNHAWYYSWLEVNLPFLKSRAAYEEALYHQRTHHIFSNMIKYKPEVALMYGMNNIISLKESVREYFPRAKFKLGKAEKQKIPQHHRADLGGTVLIITTQIPALRHNRIESGFDWGAFGRMLAKD